MTISTIHFNQSAHGWDKPEKIEKAIESAEKIKSALKIFGSDFQHTSILEIGCGTGLLGGQFLSESTSYLGVDASDEMLKVLKAKFPSPKVTTLNADAEAYDFSTISFDLMISQMAFHHLRDPAKLLHKLAQRSHPAKFVIVDLDQEDGSFHPDPKNMGVHHFGFSKQTIESWCDIAGLKLAHYSILDVIEKNGQRYPQFLAILA